MDVWRWKTPQELQAGLSLKVCTIVDYRQFSLAFKSFHVNINLETLVRGGSQLDINVFHTQNGLHKHQPNVY